MSQKIIATCPLCKNNAELQKSHFLPAAMYKNMQYPGDTSHISLDRKNLAVNNPRTSKQVKDYLLCAQCEDRFSKNGERWVMTNGYHSSGMFPIQMALKNATPSHHAEDFSTYSGQVVPDIEMEPLVYFATSVFWRAAVHDWGDAEYRLQLGSQHQEEFRQFLAGTGSFPTNAALLIVVSDATTMLEIAAFPFGGKINGTYHSYQFNIPGVEFTLSLGQRMPRACRRICAFHSPERWIFMGHGNSSLQMASDLMADRARALTNCGQLRI
jgi:hypothetical protein